MADRISSKGLAGFEDLSSEAVDLMEITGVVKWFDVAKGFGFITVDDGQDVFVHYSNIDMSGFRVLEEGQAVEFTVGAGQKGPQAESVRLLA